MYINGKMLERRTIMSLTPSRMLALGTQAPDFTLPDTEGNMISRPDFADRKGLLVMFICNHCPYVQHVRDELARLGREYQEKGIGVVAINANDVANYPEDRPEKMKEEKEKAGYTFPYLYDETQETAKAFGAACTPDFFLFDQNMKLVYRGQLDDARPGSGAPVNGKDIREALEAVLHMKPVPADQQPSIGCNIKWKPGNEPDYFGRPV
jgi:peroxiredoxin